MGLSKFKKAPGPLTPVQASLAIDALNNGFVVKQDKDGFITCTRKNWEGKTIKVVVTPFNYNWPVGEPEARVVVRLANAWVEDKRASEYTFTH